MHVLVHLFSAWLGLDTNAVKRKKENRHPREGWEDGFGIGEDSTGGRS